MQHLFGEKEKTPPQTLTPDSVAKSENLYRSVSENLLFFRILSVKTVKNCVQNLVRPPKNENFPPSLFVKNMQKSSEIVGNRQKSKSRSCQNMVKSGPLLVKTIPKVVHFLSKHDHFLTKIVRNIQKSSEISKNFIPKTPITPYFSNPKSFITPYFSSSTASYLEKYQAK